jgi:hypothetical protein
LVSRRFDALSDLISRTPLCGQHEGLLGREVRRLRFDRCRETVPDPSELIARREDENQEVVSLGPRTRRSLRRAGAGELRADRRDRCSMKPTFVTELIAMTFDQDDPK